MPFTTRNVSPVGLTVPGICIIEKGSSNWKKILFFRKNSVLKGTTPFGPGKEKTLTRMEAFRENPKRSSNIILFLFIRGKQSLVESRDEFFF